MRPTVLPSLEGSLLKLDRAREHVHEAATLANRFLDRSPEPFEVVPEIDLQTGDHLWKARINQVVPPRLPILIGDAIHNLRTSLDHLVWQLCLLGDTQPTKRTEFPIYLDCKPLGPGKQGFYPDGIRKLTGIAPPAQEIIETVQPYSTGQGKRDALWRLHRLDIIDKHRFVPVVAGVNTNKTMIADISHVSVLKIQFQPNGPFNDGDVLLRIPRAVWEESLPIPIEPHFSFDVALDIEGDVTLDLIRFLQQLHHYVRDEVVERFRPFFEA